MQSLQRNLTKVNPAILATWSGRDQEVIYSHIGLKWPRHKEGEPVEAKITDYQEEKQFAALAKALLEIQRYKGIRDLLGKVENERMVHFLSKEFADMTVRELWSAMDLASAPDNPFNLQYNGRVVDFTNDYLTSVLRPYRMYRAALINRYLEAEIHFDLKQNTHADAEPVTLTADQMQRKVILDDMHFCQLAFDNHNAAIPFAGLDRVYEILVTKYRQVEFTDNRIEAFKQTAKDRLRRQAKDNGRAKKIIQALELGTGIGDDDFALVWKKVAMENYLRELKEIDSSPAEIFRENIIPKEKKDRKSLKKSVKN